MREVYFKKPPAVLIGAVTSTTEADVGKIEKKREIIRLIS
jgi:hypothetical protein